MKRCKAWISGWYDPKTFFYSDHPVKVTGTTANHKERVRSWLEYLGRVSLQSLCIGCNSSRGAWEQLSCCSTPPFLPLIFCREVGYVSTMYRKKNIGRAFFQLNKVLKAIQFQNRHEILTSMYFPPKFEFLDSFSSSFLPSKCF